MDTIRTACPLDCWDCCGMVAYVENGRVIKVEGDPDHPITRGTLCGKGKKLVDRLYHPDRVLSPKKKVAGEWIDIAWDQAFSEIAEKMIQAKEQYGPTSVMLAFDSGSGGMLKALEGRFFNLFGGYTDAKGSLCWTAGLDALRYDMGIARSHDPHDHVNSRSIVVWGRNVSVTNMHMMPFIKDARKKGARLVVINPLPIDITASADVVIKPRPGTDGALALAVARILLDRGTYDRMFVTEHAVGFERFTEYLQTISVGDAVSITDVSREQMELLADIYQDGPTTTLLGLGLQRYANGGNTIRSITALAAMSGNVGVSGGGVNYANQVWGRWFDWDALTLPERRTAYRAFSRVRQAEEIFEADPPVRVLFSSRANPVAQTPNATRLRKAYESINCVVVMDMFMNDTAEYADYFLPCTSVFEEEDILYSSMWHSYLSYVNRCVEPAGDTKPDWQIFAGIAEKLGFADEFVRPLEEWMSAVMQPLVEAGVTVDRLQLESMIAAPSPVIPWSDYRFETPSGKYEFYSERAKEDGLSPIPTYEPALENPDRAVDKAELYPYHLLTVHPRRSLNTQHYHITRTEKPVIEMSPELADCEGLSAGNLVEIYNERGRLQGVVKIMSGIHPKTINVEQGWWRKMGASVNDLTPNHHADMGLSSALYDCLCAIQKI